MQYLDDERDEDVAEEILEGYREALARSSVPPFTHFDTWWRGNTLVVSTGEAYARWLSAHCFMEALEDCCE